MAPCHAPGTPFAGHGAFLGRDYMYVRFWAALGAWLLLMGLPTALRGQAVELTESAAMPVFGALLPADGTMRVVQTTRRKRDAPTPTWGTVTRLLTLDSTMHPRATDSLWLPLPAALRDGRARARTLPLRARKIGFDGVGRD